MTDAPRIWTKKERDDLIALWNETKFGPKKLSDKTGIPVEQIKFWLSSADWMPKRKRGAILGDESTYRSKYQDWYQWRGETLRGRFLALARLYPWAANPPTRPELIEWLRGLTMACYYCDEGLTPKNFSVDHRQPVSRGGTSAFNNLAPVCKRCNDVKGSMTEQEYLDLRRMVATWEDGGKAIFRRLRGGFIPSRRGTPAEVPTV